MNFNEKVPNIRQTIIAALERGEVLTNGKADDITCSTEGGRTLRRLRQEGYPIAERWRANRLRDGRIKEFYYTQETLQEIREARRATLINV